MTTNSTMKHNGTDSRRTIAWVFAHVLLLFWAGIASAVEIYVSPVGRDDRNGRTGVAAPDGRSGPVASLEQARKIVRLLVNEPTNGPQITVLIREGTYRLKQPLVLQDADSGVRGGKVVYAAYPGEHPVLSGSMVVGGFRPWKGSVLSSKVEGLPAQQRFHELYYRGRRQILARHPNFNPARPIDGGWAYVGGKPLYMGPDYPSDSRTEFDYAPPAFPATASSTNLEVFIFPRYNWNSDIVPVAKIDPVKRHIQLAAKASYAVRPLDRFYIQNSLELLDSPGEWYYDSVSSTLYFWPPVPDANPQVEVPVSAALVRFDPGAHDIELKGLGLEGAWGTALQLTRTTNCVVEGNLIHNLAGFQFPAVLIRDGLNNRFSRNRISEVGADGLLMSGGDVDTLAECGNTATDNEVDHYGLDRKDTAGIRFSGVGLRVSHNFIHDAPRWAVLFTGNACAVEYNRIQDVCLETADTGAIYTGGRVWSDSRGSAIRYNSIKRAPGFGQVNRVWKTNCFSCGVYLDDNASGLRVEGNLIDGVSWCGVMLHEARDNIITNNVFLECGPEEIGFTGWLAVESSWPQYLPKFSETYQRLSGKPAWVRAGWLNLSPEASVAPDGTTMRGNRIERNIFFYRNPATWLYLPVTMRPEDNVFDHNLVWHFEQPVKTGAVEADHASPTNFLKAITLSTNARSSARWTVKSQTPGSSIQIAKEEGPRSFVVRTGAGVNKPTEPPAATAIDSPLYGARAGDCYELVFRVKASLSDTLIQVSTPFYIGTNYQFPQQYPLNVGVNWETRRFQFRVPLGGDARGFEGFDGFKIRLGSYTPRRKVWFTPLELHPIVAKDSWEAWRDRGMDRSSVVGNPGFLGPDHGDYRLADASLGRKMGFQDLPFKEMGIEPKALQQGWPLSPESR